MDLVGGQEIFVKLNEWIASLWVWFSYLESDGAELRDWLIHLFIQKMLIKPFYAIPLLDARHMVLNKTHDSTRHPRAYS